ncbi:MAG: hypothetical protein Q8R10_13020 [Pseudomonas sp.]|uniref:hypothetical protein n=1 Tax=Pseudomonas sp. TaxID=306 RepID=UPI00273337FB|nr:hypothetical protein [Pseudomonas sp.]MDP3847332.1 hypothetical protein [Pseudomonas sp.]
MKSWLWLLCWLVSQVALAAEPRVRVETRLSPAAPYLLGSTLRLEIDLLTSSWFTQAPQPAELQLPGALITPPNGQADKLTVSRDGESYFGLRLTYLISPIQAQNFSIPALDFSLQLGQASGPLRVSSQALSFNAQAPAGAMAEAPAGNLLVAQQVHFSQQIERSATPLKVGDSLTRRLLVEADGAQAMLIAPAEFAEVSGLKTYPLPAEVKPLSDGRGAVSGGQRRDSLSYVIEHAGSYRLPAMQVRWWDATAGQLRSAEVPAVDFEAQANTAYRLPFDLQADLQRLGRGQHLQLSRLSLLLIGSLLLLGLAGYLARPWLSQQRRRLQNWRARRQATWLASEAYAWRQLQRAWRHTALPLAPLYAWLQRSGCNANLRELGQQLPAAAGQALQQALAASYGAPPMQFASTQQLRNSLPALRRALRKQARAKAPALRPLNPRPTPRPQA